MKFDVIVGNPPYQLSDGGYGRSASPIYQKFVEQAKKMNPRYLIMVIPARWFSGGKGLDKFREDMLNDKRIREMHDYPDATDVFPAVQIKGGICYFLWDRDNKGLCKVSSYKNGALLSSMKRPLLDFGADTFIRYNEAISIVEKVKELNEKSIKDIVSNSKPFGFRTNFSGKEKPFPNSVILYQNGGIGYIRKNEIGQNIDAIDKYKVFIPPLGSGSDSFPHPILGQPFIGEPNTACTETYIFIGKFKTKKEAKYLVSYISTRFFRFLVLLNKPAQHATKKVYHFVPMQDFSESWTDEKLYKKYCLTREEISFIESMIRPMGIGEEA
jgi:site-specific DNA-methyltransferase (adenine-specific)